jgi:hypothetical protein
MSPTADGRMVHTYAMQGDTAKAKAAYQDFLTLWKTQTPIFRFLSLRKRNTRSCNSCHFSCKRINQA